MKHIITAALCLLPIVSNAEPIFPSSVTSNDIDFITPDDPSTFHCLAFQNQSRQEMPSKLRDGLFLDNVFVFTAQFSDGTTVPLWIDPNIGNQATVTRYAELAGHRIGQLPTLMRDALTHVTINAGDATAHAEEQGHFFALYADNMDKRISTHDLSETIFHEATHAALQANWIDTNDWQDAIAADTGFITDYAASDPGEDFAESALFAYTYLRNPERLPANVRQAVIDTIPNRVNVFDNIIIQWAPHSYRVNPTQDCT